jgi:cyclohexa-1,5-dienecarbonyl-CoA hydratase
MSTETSPVAVWREREGRLLRLRLSRPRANLLDAGMVAALSAALADAAGAESQAPALRGVLLDHAGPDFCLGASVAEHLPGAWPAMLSALHGLLLAVLGHPAPVLVAVRGSCLGGGLELALAGHLLFAAPDARLGQPEIRLGVFAPAASALLPERLPLALAEELLLSGRSVTGEEAARMGLITAAAADPEAAALAWFDAHAGRCSAAALRAAAAAVRGELVARVRARLAALEQLYGQLMTTRDAVEGLNAFLEKRPPRWEDR